jgi:hypothetical protein
MKRPDKVPSNAKWDKEAQSWVVYNFDGEYDIYTHYNDDGVVVMVFEMEV